MKTVFVLVTAAVVGVAVIGLEAYGAKVLGEDASRRQARKDAWFREMAEFRSRSEGDRRRAEVEDSLDAVAAFEAVRSGAFVIEIDQVTFKRGRAVFVSSNTNFLSVDGDRAVIQISPSNFEAGPNGVGGVTVNGYVSELEVRQGRGDRVTVSYGVTGVGVNARVDVSMEEGSAKASAMIVPNFSSRTVWVYGKVVPLDQARVFEGSSL